MADKSITINDFTPGLQTQADPSTLLAGAAQVCQNVTLDRGDLRVREGRVASIGVQSNLTTNIRAVSELYLADHSPTHRFVAVNATRIYWNVNTTTATAWVADTVMAVGQVRKAVTNTPTGATSYLYEVTAIAGDFKTGATEPTWTITEGGSTTDDQVTWKCRFTDMWQEINSAFTVHATNDISFQDFGGFLYIIDGSGWLLELSADGTFTTYTDFPGPTTAPSLLVSSADLMLDDADNSTAKTSADPNYLWQGGAKVGGNWTDYAHTDDKWHTFNDPGDPDTGDVDQIYAVAQINNVYDGDDIARAYSLAMYVSAEDNHTLHLDCGDVYLMRNLPPPPVSGKLPTRNDAYDLSGATRVNFSMCVEADEMLGTAGGACTFYLVLGETSTVSGWQKVQITTDAAGTALASLSFGAGSWNDFSVDITGLSDASINAVRWLGFYFENLDLKPETDPAGTENDYIRISFSPITVNMSAASFMQGEYEFTNTLWDDGLDEESAEYIDVKNLAKPYPILTINYNLPSSIQITVTRPIGSAAEKSYIYARGGVNAGDFKRIGEATFTGDNTAVRTASITWQGIYKEDQPYLAQYIGRPPKACTMMTVYRNRAIYAGRLPRQEWRASTAVNYGEDVVPITRNGFYYVCTVAGTTGATIPSWGTTTGGTTADNDVTWTCFAQDAADVLYYSNIGDPTRVATVPFSLAEMPASTGGWVDTERHGDNISGLIGAGRWLFAFKRLGIFRASGDPGVTGNSPDAFFLERLQTTEGCVSPQSVVLAEHRVCWQGKDKILSIAADELKPTSLTENILPTVKAYTAT